MLEGEPIPLAVRLGTGLDLDSVDLLARVNQAVVWGVVANRKGNIEALAQGAGMKEQLSGCAYGLGWEDERIPCSFSKRPSGISLNQPCVDPRLQRMSITAPLVFAAISSEWNWEPGEIGFTGNFILSEQQSPGVSNIVFG